MKKDQEVKSQSLGFLATFILISAGRAVIGYIAVWLFKPIWNWLWNKKN